jgi:hypothetical protein
MNDPMSHAVEVVWPRGVEELEASVAARAARDDRGKWVRSGA